MSHPVHFGLSVTPTADPAEIGRARRADLLGLDLLAVQDHPYQSDHLEMWTYLTHLASTAAPPNGLRLAGWHHDLGLDTFIFWPAANPDDQLERFANDVIPCTRALVAG